MRKIKRFLFTLFVAVTLTGCASMSDTTTSDTMPVVSLINPQATSLNNMSRDDQKKLQAIVNTAKANETVEWGGYEFTSLKVYVNASGQPCRNYIVRASSLFSDKKSQQTACRDNKGVWRLVS